MLLDLRHCPIVDEGPDPNSGFSTWTDFQSLDSLGQSFGELVVDARLNVDPVGTYACLPRVAELRVDSAGDSSIDIGVVKDQKRSVASELEADTRDVLGSLDHQFLSD